MLTYHLRLLRHGLPRLVHYGLLVYDAHVLWEEGQRRTGLSSVPPAASLVNSKLLSGQISALSTQDTNYTEREENF